MKPRSLLKAKLIAAAALALPFAGAAATYTLTNTTADAFLASGPSGGTSLAVSNYGGAGTLAIASAASTKGEFNSVIKFNTATAVSQFNTTYGAGNWTITGLTLSLASNTGTSGANPGNPIFNPISGGAFGINWLANDSWVEGSGTPNAPSVTGVNFNSISSLLAGSVSLGAFTYTPPGNNVYTSYSLSLDLNLLSDAAAGGDVSLYFYAADDQISYLFNSRSFNGAGRPQLEIAVAAVPEPTALSLLCLGLVSLLCLRGRKTK